MTIGNRYAQTLCGDEMNFWSGNDDQIVPLMAMGGKGVISVLSNVAPAETHKLTQLCLDQIVPLMAMGGKGVISVLSNVAPAETHKLTQLCLEGKYEEARRMQLDYLPLINALFCEVNPIPVKKAMEILGWKVGDLICPSSMHCSAKSTRFRSRRPWRFWAGRSATCVCRSSA